MLGDGWIRLLTVDALATAAQLVAKLNAAGLPTPELRAGAFCRLVIHPQYLFLSRDLYRYALPDCDDAQQMTLTLQPVETQWGTLHGKSIKLDLSRNLVRVVRAIEDRKDPLDVLNIKSGDLGRQIRDSFQNIQAVGLRKFIYVSKGRYQLAVTSAE